MATMKVRHIIRRSLLMTVVAALLTGCDMIKEDRDDCPTGLYVNFVYDYNIQRADMFKDHVGSVTLYVFDESDKLVAQRTVSGSELSVYGCNIHFTEQELAPGHQYRLSAVGLQKDWDEALATKGAKYRKTTLDIGDSRQQLGVALDRHSQLANPTYFDVSTEAPLDTLWHTLQVMTASAANQPTATRYHENAKGEPTTNAIQTVKLEKGVPTYATVSLIRDTNHLNLSLFALASSGGGFEDIDVDDYEVFILDANGDVDYQNTVVTPTDSLIYRPYAQWSIPVSEVDADEEIRSAHYDLMFNRLMYNTTTDKSAVLCVRKDGKNVAVLNLPYYLCMGRMAYEINNYQPQEYLDREYDYRLELFLLNGSWAYVKIHVLSWSKRSDNLAFN